MSDNVEKRFEPNIYIHTYTSSILHDVQMGLYAHFQTGSSTDNNDHGFIIKVKSYGSIRLNYPSTATYKYALYAICWITFTVLVEKLTDLSRDGRSAVRSAAT